LGDLQALVWIWKTTEKSVERKFLKRARSLGVGCKAKGQHSDGKLKKGEGVPTRGAHSKFEKTLSKERGTIKMSIFKMFGA